MFVSGDPAGINVHDFINKGLPELFKTPHGGVLTRDAGYIVQRAVFDGDPFLSIEIVVHKGRTRKPTATSSCSARSCRGHSASEAPADPAQLGSRPHDQNSLWTLVPIGIPPRGWPDDVSTPGN